MTTLIQQSLDEDKTIRALCEERFHNFHHGLTLLTNDQSVDSFKITAEVVVNPEKALSQWVVERFRDQPPSSES